MTNIYSQDGVNLFEGDSFSSFAGELCKSTYNNSTYVKVRDFSHGHFRGPAGWQFQRLPPDCYTDAASDGIGTKVVLIDASLGYANAARDWVAMTCGDITRWGGLPLILVNILDVNTLGKTGTTTNLAFRKMMLGLKQVADEQALVMYKGSETAELGVCVGSENPDAVTKFNWAGTAIGVYRDQNVITGDTLAPGQIVVALREYGFRSNGISSVRKALAIKFGENWYTNPAAKDAIKFASTPSTIYDRMLSTANGWFDKNLIPRIKMHAVVHLTGGSFKSKFAEDILFPRGLSARLTRHWEPTKIMQQCAFWRGMKDKECYEVWNCGQGALVVIDKKDFRAFYNLAACFDVEIKVCGKIVNDANPHLLIKSGFFDREEIVF